MSSNKNSLRGILRRALAQLLAFLMVFGLAVSGLGVRNAYATELQSTPEDRSGANDSGATEAMAFTWKSALGAYSEGDSTYTHRFDIKGLNTGETSYSSASIDTTYNLAGYGTWIVKADTLNAAPPSSSNYGAALAGYTVVKPDPPHNGAVMTYPDASQPTSLKNRDLGIEYRMKVSKALDNKHVIVDYYVHDTTGTGPRTFFMGSGSDTKIKGDDLANVLWTGRSFHMVNRSSLETLDLVLNDSDLGLTPPDKTYVGVYYKYWDYMFTGNSATFFGGDDSGLSYSWKFNLNPYETVHRRVAFLVKATSYYVSSSGGNDSNEGTFQSPFKTLQHAVDKLQGKKGFIYIMDYTGEPVTLNGGSGTDVAIATTDYEHQATAVPYTGPTVEIVAANPGSPLFKQTGSGKYTIEKLHLSGNKAAVTRTKPLISVEAGTLRLGEDAVVENAKTSDYNSAAAIDIVGGTLHMEHGSTVRNNETPASVKTTGSEKQGKGAINFASGHFVLAGSKQSGGSVITVSGNKDADGNKSNVFVAANQKISVMQSIAGSSIGISKLAVGTSNDLPSPFAGTGTPTAAQEKNFAELGSGVSASGVIPFSNFFKPDQDETYGTSIVESKTAANNAALRRAGYTITFKYQDAQGNTVPGAENRAVKNLAAGEAVNEPKPTVTPTSYKLSRVETDEVVTSGGTAKLILDNTATSPDLGKVTGFMPKQNIVVTYKYVRENSTITFDAKGGTPTPAQLSGLAGNPTNAISPTVVKYGYNFLGWNKRGVSPVAPAMSIPTTFPTTPEVYDAIYSVNHGIKFGYTSSYENSDGSIVFQTTTVPSAYSVEDGLTGNRKVVPGYVWAPADSFTNPTTYQFSDQTAAAPFGTFDNVAGAATYGNFTGRFPGQDAAITWRYRVDPSHAGFQLKVNHKTASGTTVAPTTITMVKPEQPVVTHAVNAVGYSYDRLTVDHGDTANSTDPNPLTNALTGSADALGNYNGVMPNQDVEITYYYTGAGMGQEFTVAHEDLGTVDSLLKNIVPATVTGHATDDVVEGDVLTMPQSYGYIFSTHSDNPVGAVVAGETTTFNTATKHYKAKMPTTDMKLTYSYTRDPSAWSNIQFYSGKDAVGGTELGTLSSDNMAPADDPTKQVSPDVQANGTNSFKVSVLKDNSAGQGYTYADLKAKRLLPIVTANDYHYMLDGWFVDTNNNRVMDGSEHLLQDTDRFQGGENLVAAFKEDPAWWVDINFGPFDSHVTWNAGVPTTLHTWKDKTWAQVEPAASSYTGEVNYIRKGFVRSSDSHLMAATDAIANGETYLIKFTPDPVVFGLPVHPVDAGGSLDTQGKGVVTAYDTKPGYKYIVVDPDGKVVGVEDGNPAGRTYFNNLTPGTTYQVYEAEGDNTAQVGDDISNVPAPISAPSPAHVPAVDTNKQITYDPNDETKVNLTIDPADRDADYALIDENGNVVTTPETQADGWQAGTPGRITFSGLTPNKPYTVVARPHGRNDITPLQKLPDGTVVVMDPGGEIDVPKFSITTTDGESEITTVNGNAINTNYFDEAHKDETVVLTAPATNSAGETFKAWRVTTGVIPGINSQLGNATLTFTMPDTNVVLTAYYNRNLNGNAPVTDEVRGGNPGEMALDPNEVPGLENQLTTPDDQVLMNVNHADVSYKVVYNKKNVPSSVATALKNDMANVEAANHPDAFTAAWEVQTNIERYVNGRLVQRTTPSNATFRTYVQLDKEDVNNLDYQLLREDPSNPGNFIPQTLTPADVYASGGLFQFTAEEGVKYYLTYSKAYKVTWINNRDTVAPWPQYSFPVRKGDSPSDSDYTTQYNTVTNNEPTGAATHQTDPATGVEYDWKGWSRKADKFKQYDDTAPIKKRTIVYGYWEDNRQVVDDTRNGLEDAIKKALKLSDDFFLKRKETAALINGVPGVHTGINDAIAVFEKTGPRATAAELQQALDDLLDTIRRYDNTLNPRYNHYNQITNGNLSGGASGGGGGRGNGGRGGSGGGSGRASSGGGGGTSLGSTAGGPSFIGKEAFVADYEQGYTVGTNGNWQLVNPEHSEWIFTLNGGIRLVSRWAKLDYANGDVNKNGWYHFNSHGIMDFGWFRDEKLDWYYCNTEHDGWLGKMKLGWHYDEADKHWYYLDPQTGVMHTGWTEINGKWYYFAPTTSANTYEYDAVNERWFYKSNSAVRPMGSMYQNETTPDGYRVDANGAWIH